MVAFLVLRIVWGVTPPARIPPEICPRSGMIGNIVIAL